jgi:hypothetical protein
MKRFVCIFTVESTAYESACLLMELRRRHDKKLWWWIAVDDGWSGGGLRYSQDTSKVTIRWACCLYVSCDGSCE